MTKLQNSTLPEIQTLLCSFLGTHLLLLRGAYLLSLNEDMVSQIAKSSVEKLQFSYTLCTVGSVDVTAYALINALIGAVACADLWK